MNTILLKLYKFCSAYSTPKSRWNYFSTQLGICKVVKVNCFGPKANKIACKKLCQKICLISFVIGGKGWNFEEVL